MKPANTVDVYDATDPEAPTPTKETTPEKVRVETAVISGKEGASQMTPSDVVQAFQDLVKEKVKAGMSRAHAVARIAKEHPDIYAIFRDVTDGKAVKP